MEHDQLALPVKDASGRSVFRRVPVPSTCVRCGAALRRKSGRNGPFLGCSGYPACDHTERAHIGIACPRPLCTGVLVEKLVRTDEGSQAIISCTEFPSCRFSVWAQMETGPCIWCDLPVTVNERGFGRRCLDPACAHRSRGNERLLDVIEHAIKTGGSIEHAASLLAIAAGLVSTRIGMTHDAFQQQIAIGREKIQPTARSLGEAP